MDQRSIHSSASIGDDTTFGQFVVIEEDVIIGSGCRIGHHVVIRRGSRIGDAVQIGDHSIIGQQPMKAANSAVSTGHAQSGPHLSNRVRVGSHSILYAGCQLSEDVFVADLATVREQVTIGQRTIVGRGVAIENQCTIGSHCKLETNAYISAYSEIGDRVFVAPGVLTSNDNFIGRTEERFEHFKGAILKDGSRVGVGAVVLPGVELSEEAVLAAGAVLTKKGNPGQVHMGIPAKPVRPVPTEQLLSDK